jgi:hypothetical protein
MSFFTDKITNEIKTFFVIKVIIFFLLSSMLVGLTSEYLKGKYHCTVDLLFDWFGIRFMTTDIFCFY